MKYLLITTFIVFTGALFLPNANAQNCRSEKRGYCVELASLAQAQMLEEFFSKDVVKEPGDLIPALYKFGLGLVGISALGALIVGGVYYMTAGDSQDRAKKGRTWLGNAIFGLVLALLSYLILNTINPDFLKKLSLNLTPINSAPQLPIDEAKRPLGSPGSSVTIGRPGQPVDPNLVSQCPVSSGCVIRTTGTGTVDCDCSGETRGQSGP